MRKPKENIHYTSTRMVKFKKTKKRKVRIWDKWNAQILLVGVLAIQPFWKPVWQYPLKLGICTPSDPATPLSGVPNRDANMFHHKTPQECSQQHYVWKPRTRTIHMFINTRMDEQIAAILLSHESEWPTNTGKYTECYTKEARSKRTSYRTPFK